MNEKHTQFDWTFGLYWLVTCTVGTAIGGTLAFLTMWSASEGVAGAAGETAGGFVAGLLFGFFFALGANIGPGILLAGKGISAARWIIYSCAAGALGVAITLALAFNIVDDMSDLASAVTIGLSLGLPVGVGQWLVLKQHGISAGGWPLISTAAYFLAAIVITTTSGDSAMPLILVSVGLIISVVTGLGMVWLQRRESAVAA